MNIDGEIKECHEFDVIAVDEIFAVDLHEDRRDAPVGGTLSRLQED